MTSARWKFVETSRLPRREKKTARATFLSLCPSTRLVVARSFERGNRHNTTGSFDALPRFGRFALPSPPRVLFSRSPDFPGGISLGFPRNGVTRWRKARRTKRVNEFGRDYAPTRYSPTRSGPTYLLFFFVPTKSSRSYFLVNKGRDRNST